MKITPLTPHEAVEQKLEDVPEKVLNCWNKIIKSHSSKTNSSLFIFSNSLAISL